MKARTQIVITETDEGLAIDVDVPEGIQDTIAYTLTVKTMEFITSVMNASTGEEKSFERYPDRMDMN